jgi:ribosomal protein L14E/L6E/L27E
VAKGIYCLVENSIWAQVCPCSKLPCARILKSTHSLTNSPTHSHPLTLTHSLSPTHSHPLSHSPTHPLTQCILTFCFPLCADGTFQALVDGPSSGVRRQAVNFRNVSLTDFKIKVGVSAASKFVAKAFDAAEINKKWEATSWAKKLSARAKRANLTDFERFVVKANKQAVSSLFSFVCSLGLQREGGRTFGGIKRAVCGLFEW